MVVATNNHYAYSTPNDREFACADLVDRAKGYGFEGYSIDGTDLPLDYDIGRTEELVATSLRGGAAVRFEVRRVQAVTGQIETDDRAAPSFGELQIDGKDPRSSSPVSVTFSPSIMAPTSGAATGSRRKPTSRASSTKMPPAPISSKGP